ncbi:MAG: Fe-S cluster assembly protein IscX [Acidobacteriota bacterium]
MIRAKIEEVDIATQKLAEAIMNHAVGKALEGTHIDANNLTWDKLDDIAIALYEIVPDLDPTHLRFTDLHKWITELDGFADDPLKSNEASWRGFRCYGSKSFRIPSPHLRRAALRATEPPRRITPESLRASVTFLASDELEARATPSPGLDKAADFIADQFKKIGLETIDGSYFQTAPVPGGTARNVVGLVRGSDSKLRNTYIIVSGHYDHVGMASSGEDRIFNGANDDASGTASVIDIARAVAAAHPKRSFLFMTFFGEERGLLGSRYYAQHPLVPPAATVAQLNLEQMGRTDASNGPQLKGANITAMTFPI